MYILEYKDRVKHDIMKVEGYCVTMSNRREGYGEEEKCYIYTRVSTIAQTEGYSLEAQQERLREYADYKNLEIAGEYCDAGKSGKNIIGRPQAEG